MSEQSTSERAAENVRGMLMLAGLFVGLLLVFPVFAVIGYLVPAAFVVIAGLLALLRPARPFAEGLLAAALFSVVALIAGLALVV